MRHPRELARSFYRSIDPGYYERAQVGDRPPVSEAQAGYDRIVVLDLSDAAVDGSQHKAPGGGLGTGPNPLAGANAVGSGRSCVTGRASPGGGWATDGANRWADRWNRT